MAALKVLSIAVASGRAGYVYLQGNQLLDWNITVKATKTASDLVGFVQGLISDLRPDIVVTEKCAADCRKGQRTKALIQAVTELASHNTVLDVEVSRPRGFPSKYEEAEHLAKHYPALKGYLPRRKRRIFDFEPRGMVIFEALVLAEAVLNRPTEQLAAAMG